MPCRAQHGGGGEQAGVIGKMFSEPENNRGNDAAQSRCDTQPLMPEEEFCIITAAEGKQPATQRRDDGQRRGDSEDETSAGVGLAKTGKPRGNFQQREHDDHADGEMDEQRMQPSDKEQDFRRMVHEIKVVPRHGLEPWTN